jgi:putative nucleotidyltransferase with HDIG domain
MPKLIGYEEFFEVLARIGRAMHESSSENEVLDHIVQYVAEAFGAMGATLRILDPEMEGLRLQAAAGLSEEYLDKGPISADRSLSEIYEASPVVIRDIDADPRVQYPREARREGIASIIGLPFEIIGGTRMVLRIFFDREIDLGEEDLTYLQHIAQQSAIAIRYSLLQSRYFTSFRSISSSIHSGGEVGEILEQIVTNIHDILRARGCIFWILNRRTRTVHCKHASGFEPKNLAGIGFDTLEELFRVGEKRSVFFRDMRNEFGLSFRSRLGKHRVVSVLGLNFDIVDQYAGVLAAYFSDERELLQSEIDFVRSLGEQGAIALHKAFRYDESMLQSVKETIEGLVLALEAKDVRTHGHSLNVAEYARLTAQEMGLPEKEVNVIYHAGLLHDIGKLAIHDQILDNLGSLSREDFDLVKKHPIIGARIVRPLSFLEDVVPLIFSHHERYNGTGYPEGLRGKEIPLGARILAVSDCFDAMTTDRPGGQNMPVKKALYHLWEDSGALYDPGVVSSFIRAIERNEACVRPLCASRDYFQKHREELELPERRRGTILDRLLKGIS